MNATSKYSFPKVNNAKSLKPTNPSTGSSQMQLLVENGQIAPKVSRVSLTSAGNWLPHSAQRIQLFDHQGGTTEFWAPHTSKSKSTIQKNREM